MYMSLKITAHDKFVGLPFTRWLYLFLKPHGDSDRNSPRVDIKCAWHKWRGALFCFLLVLEE